MYLKNRMVADTRESLNLNMRQLEQFSIKYRVIDQAYNTFVLILKLITESVPYNLCRCASPLLINILRIIENEEYLDNQLQLQDSDNQDNQEQEEVI